MLLGDHTNISVILIITLCVNNYSSVFTSP